MALCAGYVAPTKLDVRGIASLVNKYEPGLAIAGRAPETQIIETNEGHHFMSYYAGAINRPSVFRDDIGNTLMLLGFVQSDQANCLLARAVREGAASLETVEGQFVAIFSDVRSGTIHIVNDRFGCRPFYFLNSGAATYYSSNLSFIFRLASMRPDPDPIGWLQIFTYGHTLGQRTNRSKALRFRPGSHAIISTKGVEDRQYWKLGHEAVDLNADAHADETFEAFRESTAWRVKRFPRCVVALSGGLDSRLLAGSLPSEIDAIAFTLSMPKDDELPLEVKTAEQVAHCLNLTHEVRAITPGKYSQVVSDVVRLTDGLLPMHHPAKTMHYLEYMSGREGYLMGGGPGDSLAGAFVPSAEYLDPLRMDEMGRDFERRRSTSGYLDLIFSEKCLREYEGAVQDSFLASWSSQNGPTGAHRASAWAMSIRQPCFTFTSPIHNHPFFEEGTAHLGYRYADLMLKLPADWIYRKNFYRYMIYRCIPKVRGVIYANTGQLLSGSLERYTVPVRQQDRADWTKKLRWPLSVAGRVARRLGIRRPNASKRDFDYKVLSEDSKLVNEVEELLDLPNLPSFIDRRHSRSFVRNFRGGRICIDAGMDAHLFGCLATLCFTAKHDA